MVPAVVVPEAFGTLIIAEGLHFATKLSNLLTGGFSGGAWNGRPLMSVVLKVPRRCGCRKEFGGGERLILRKQNKEVDILRFNVLKDVEEGLRDLIPLTFQLFTSIYSNL